METFQKEVQNQLNESLDWMKEWACSRSYGLGSRIPWDKTYLIESLSDSTIYMAYYTIAHLLQGGVIDGSVEGPAKVKPEQLTDEVFDYIYQDTELPKNTGISDEILKELRKEFRAWYPVNLRLSGKDLVPNHLLFFIYNHVAIFPEKQWPAGIKANGFLLLNGEKMAKRTGNFITLADAVERYSADALRFAFAQAGDSMADPNFTVENVDTGILQLHTFMDWVKEMYETKDSMKTGPATSFWERVFAAQIQKLTRETDAHYQQLLFRDVINLGFFEMQKARDDYRKAVLTTPEAKLNWTLIERFIRAVVILLAPVTSFTSEHIWRTTLGEKGSVFDARFPSFTEEDETILLARNYLNTTITTFRGKIALHVKPKKGSTTANAAPKSARVYITPEYPDWYQKTLQVVKDIYVKNNNSFTDQKQVTEVIKNVDELKPHMKKVMPKVAELVRLASTQGLSEEDFLVAMPFNEKKVLEENMDFVKQDLKLEKIDLHLTTDQGTPETGNSLAPGAPGKPLVFFD